MKTGRNLFITAMVLILSVSSVLLPVQAFADDREAPLWNDGQVYFVWATEGEENSFYYHKITGISCDGALNRVPLSTIVNDMDGVTAYDIKNRTRTAHDENGDTYTQQSYEFVWAPVNTDENQNCFEVIKDTNAFKNLTTTDKLKYLHERDMTINPYGAVSGAHSISTAGDGAFKLTVFDDKYEEIDISVPNFYTYYPAYWDPVSHWESVDVSETTALSCPQYNAFLLEDTLRLSTPEYGASRKIAEIKALNVPAKAVTVSPVKDIEGAFDVHFISNFYDDVKLEIKDAKDQIYYLNIVRSNVVLKGLMTDPAGLYAAVYYPSDDSYTNYKVLLKTEYQDGKEETTLISTPIKGIETEYGDIEDEYEIMGGESLKTSWYKLNGITKSNTTNVSRFYVTVLKDFDAESNYSGGILAGAFEGIEYEYSKTGFKRVTSADFDGLRNAAPNANLRETTGDITSLDVQCVDNLVTVSGTASDTVGAVSILVLNKTDKSLLKLISARVNDDSTFSETLPLGYGSYIVKVANYEGGQVVSNENVRVRIPVEIPTAENYKYNGKNHTGVSSGDGYTLSGTVKAKNGGKYTAVATLKDGYVWADGTDASKKIVWKIDKASNPLKVKGKSAAVKYNNLKSKTQTLSVGKIIKVIKKVNDRKNYTLKSANKGKDNVKKYFKINKETGEVTIKKGLKAGTYKLKVKVKARGNVNYRASSVKTVTVTIKVK